MNHPKPVEWVPVCGSAHGTSGISAVILLGFRFSENKSMAPEARPPGCALRTGNVSTGFESLG